MSMYGLEVPPGEFIVKAHADLTATFRLTMAAIDPSAEPEGDEDELTRPRATLKVLRLPMGEDYDDEYDESGSDLDDEEMDIDDMDEQFGDVDDLDSEDSDEEAVNGESSDPSKSKQARREIAREQIKKLMEEEGIDADAMLPNGVNGALKSKKAKGKMPASDEDEEEDEDSDFDDPEGEIEEFVLCTLDPEKVSYYIFSFEDPD